MDKTYWGDYSDLYGTLEPEQIEALEEAIHARKLGRFDEARTIYQNRLPPAYLIPVVAIELSSLDGRQGFDIDRSDLLKTALASHEIWKGKETGNELRLLTLLCAESEIRAAGRLKEAVAEARDVKAHLNDQELENYTDIEVSTLGLLAMTLYIPCSLGEDDCETYVLCNPGKFLHI